MKRDTGNKFTFRRMVGFFWAIIYLTTLIMYIVSQTVAMRQATGNIENGIKLGVSASEEAIENSLEMIDMYLYENYYLNSPTSISGLCYTYLYNEDRTESQAALQTLSKLVQSIPSWTGNVSFDMMYITGGEKSIWLDAGEAGSYQVRNALKKVIEEHNISSSEDVVKRYMVYESEGRQYLLRVMKLDRCYFVIGLSENAILSLLDNAKYSKDSICFAADADGNVIFSSAPIQGCLYPVNDGKYINDGGKTYLQAGYQSNITGYYFGILTDKVSISHELFGTKVLFGMVILITTILFLVSRLFVGRFIEKPITYGIRTMHEIEQGDFERSIDVNTPIYEFSKLADSFNHMIERIGHLKIEKYESELETQKATMQYLQLQIKPHFYANLLNIIYSLAESKDFETIQHVSMAIVNYSRYMFRDATDLVELKREIDFLKNYMEIQEIRYRKQIELKMDIPDKLINVLVPPFIIQTFVENSVKYAFTTKKNCLIKVKAELSEDGENMLITIHDNGSGYPESLLTNNYGDSKIEGHIGLTNVYKRLHIIYDDKANLELTNDGGALTKITLPYIDIEI